MDTTWIVIGAIVAGAVGFSFYMSAAGKKANSPKWQALAALISGTASGNGVKGTYNGREVESKISNVGGGTATRGGRTTLRGAGEFMAGESAGSWVYEIAMKSGSPGQGQDWQIFQHEGQWRSDPAGQAINEQLQSGEASSLLPQAGLHKLFYNSKTGELRGAFSQVINAAPTQSLSEINKNLSNQPVPSPEQFKAQLDLLGWIASKNSQAG